MDWEEKYPAGIVDATIVLLPIRPFLLFGSPIRDKLPCLRVAYPLLRRNSLGTMRTRCPFPRYGFPVKREHHAFTPQIDTLRGPY